jgi:hypothetical protein
MSDDMSRAAVSSHLGALIHTQGSLLPGTVMPALAQIAFRFVAKSVEAYELANCHENHST